MSSRRADQPRAEAVEGGSNPGDDASLPALEEKARRLLKRCRYDDAAQSFRQVVVVVQQSAMTRSRSRSMRSREIAALEGLAICLSRQLDDAGAEEMQRKALALRCREWEGGLDDGNSVSNGAGSSRVAASKRAALPCLRNLASFVSNQGRHIDAEAVLRTVLNALEHPECQPQEETESDNCNAHDRGKGKGKGKAEDGHGGGKPTPASSSASARADGGKGLFDAPPSPGAEEESRSERHILAGDGSISRGGGSAAVGGTPGGGASEGGRGDDLRATVAREAEAAVAQAMSSAAAVAAAGREAAMPTRAPPSSRESSPAPAAGHGAGRAARDGTSPAPPPPSPVPATKQRSASLAIARSSRCSSSSSSSGGGGGGGGSSSEGGELEESKVSDGRLGEGGAGGGGDAGGEGDGGAEDVEVEELGVDVDEEPEQMAAITRHHLAVVVHAQGRVKEAEQLLEESLRTLRRRRPPQAVWIAQALHDLAGVVRPSDPGRACALYREALQLLEEARGVNHFLTAPTLAKLGSLLGECLVAATPPAPAAPAGPGLAGVARAAGLAEAVCAPAGQAAGGGKSMAEAVAAAAGRDWDAKEAEAMIKRAVLIQGRYLGLRHPAVASSMRAMAELYRRQGRLADAEPLFRRAIGIWEASPGPMDSDAVAALHGMAHCVLAGAGADWLGRFEEAFALVDQAYRISSSTPGNDSSSRLLLEALRMIRSRQRQGRGDPQPASAAIMEGVWTGRWDPAKNEGGGGGGGSAGSVSKGHIRSRSGSGDNPRCAVCLEEVGGAEVVPGATGEATGSAAGGRGPVEGRDEVRGSSSSCFAAGDWTANIGSEEASLAETQNAHARSFAYLPCGHRFHTHCIGRWLAHSSSCPSCRSRVEDDQESPTDCPSSSSSAAAAPPSTASSPALPPPAAARADEIAGGSAVSSAPASATAEIVGIAPATRSVGSQAEQADGEVGREGAAAHGVGVRAPFC